MTSEIYKNNVIHNNSNLELENSKNSVNIDSIDGYTILGHGGNGYEKIIVPEGSIVIAKAHPGDDKTGSSLELLEEKKKILNIKHIQTILNPLNNAKNLYKLFGSVSIFRGGQSCPNFYYSLIAIHPHSNNMMKIGVSGIIKIPVSNLNSMDNTVFMFNRNMTIRMYQNNADKFKIGSLFKLCDNTILKLNTVDNAKEKILKDKLELYNDILRNIDTIKEDIVYLNDDDLLIMIGIRKSKKLHVMSDSGVSNFSEIKEEIKRVLKEEFDSQSKNERNFYINRSNDKISLGIYIDKFKEGIPDITRSLEADIQVLSNRTIEEYIDDYLSSQPGNDKLISCINSLKEKLNISQENIFKNSLKPTITYNFVCRVNNNSRNWYNSDRKIERSGILNNRRMYISNRSVYNTRTINNRIKNARNSSNGSSARNTRKLWLVESVKNQISEAELQRKGQIRNASNLLYHKNNAPEE